MNNTNICHISKCADKCLEHKCEFWTTEVTESRPEQCVKHLYAFDFMSPKDYMDLVRLLLMSERVKSALDEITEKLGQLGGKSLFHPFKNKAIVAKRNELQRLNEHMKHAELLRGSIFKRYEKIRQSLISGMLREGGYKNNYETFDPINHLWTIGGVRLREAVVAGHCGLLNNIEKEKPYELQTSMPHIRG